MEQGTGIEPAFTAWEAVVLPIYEPCDNGAIITDQNGKFNPFLSAATVFSASVTYLLPVVRQIIPQAIFLPGLPEGCVVKSSGAE